ncbi:MAG: peptidase C39 family protein [Thalassobaculum sp.]
MTASPCAWRCGRTTSRRSRCTSAWATAGFGPCRTTTTTTATAGATRSGSTGLRGRTAPHVPYIHQTTEFTCGPASLMMAMKSLVPGSVPDPDDELRIWREATTIFMTSGHGGCGPRGLALAAHRRGFRARIAISADGPLFIDTVRSPAKKQVLERVQAMMKREVDAAGIETELTRTAPADLEQALEAGWIPLLLVSSYRFNAEKAPHWVVVTGVDDRFILVHDPDMDEDLMKSDVDCTHVPIPRSAFTSMTRFGRSRLQAVVYVGRGDAAAGAKGETA